MTSSSIASSSVVDIADLSVYFGSICALDQVTLSFPRGSIIGLIGRNGAGKSTLLRHVVGALVPRQGSVTTLGCPSPDLEASQLNRIGALDQELQFLDWLTVRQHLDYVASFYEQWDHDLEYELLAELELETQPRVRDLSGGGRQKLGLIMALGHRPELLVLDEPVNSLDPLARDFVLRHLLEQVRERETTIIMSSHLLHDIERIVDRIVCLHVGRVLVDESSDALAERFVEWIVAPRPEAPKALPPRFHESFIVAQSTRGGSVQLIVADADTQREAFQQRHRVEVIARPLRLEEVLLHLLGRAS